VHAEPTDCSARRESQALDVASTSFREPFPSDLDVRHTYPLSPVCAIGAID
jgi:hypothetical protein